jgi:cbb3-type cytochrome oxidase maturation protein
LNFRIEKSAKSRPINLSTSIIERNPAYMIFVMMPCATGKYFWQNSKKYAKKYLSEMSIIFLLIFFSLVLAIGFLAAFIWSVRDGQFDDDYTPSVRILFENDKTPEHNTTNEEL